MGNFKYFIPLGVIAALLFSKTAAAQQAITVASAPKAGTESWTRFDALYKKYGAQYGVNWKWLKAIALNESSNGTNSRVALGIREPANKASVSYDNKSWGLMQFVVATANDRIPGTTYIDLNNPEYSIKLGAMHFVWMMKQFPNEAPDSLLKKIVLSYNQGVGNTKNGKDYTGEYYPRFMRNLALVESRDS